MSLNKSFPTLIEAHNYVNGLIRAGVTFQPSRLFEDRLNASKRNRFLLLLGVERKAHEVCTKLAPGGHWNVEVECPGTEYEKAGIFGPRSVTTQHHRAAAWYSRYLPYAYAMMKAEWVFKCLGVNFESINAYYGTCMGYYYLGHDGYDNQKGDWTRIDTADVDLYTKLADASNEIKPPSLPFETVHAPACCFVGVQAPHLLAQYAAPDTWMWQHTCEVLHSLNMPVPKHKKTA